jgi:hypothetical protein
VSARAQAAPIYVTTPAKYIDIAKDIEQFTYVEPASRETVGTPASEIEPASSSPDKRVFIAVQNAHDDSLEINELQILGDLALKQAITGPWS